jgi:uncharacterized protein YbjQ (UPF0145 family)
VVELAVAVLVAADDVAVPTELAVPVALAPALELEELEELEPQAARARTRAQTVAAGVMRVRARIEDQREVSWPPCWERCYGVAMAQETTTAGLPMTTGLELTGLQITETLGVVYGLVVRSMGFAGSVGASFKALRRGEIHEYTQLLEDSRRHAIDRMVDNARLMDADAIVAVRFDSSEIGQQFTEIVAYGTAVKVQPTG